MTDPLSVLQRLGGGKLLEELAEALTKTAGEVVTAGKPGNVTLSLAISNKGPGDVLIVIDEKLSRRSPRKDAKGAIFYAVDGGLYREDPRQYKLDFRTVDTTTGEIIDAGTLERAERIVE